MCAERQISQRFREVCPCAEVDTAQEAFLQRERTKEYKRAFDRGSLHNINGYPEPSEFVSRFQSTYMRDFQHPDIQALYHGYEKEAAGEINLDPPMFDDPYSRCCSCPPWGCADRCADDCHSGCGTGGCCSPCGDACGPCDPCGSSCGSCGPCTPTCDPCAPCTTTCTTTCTTNCAPCEPCAPACDPCCDPCGGCHCGNTPCECEYSIIFDQAKTEDDIPNSRPSMSHVSLADPPSHFKSRMGPPKRPPRKSVMRKQEEKEAYDQADRIRRSRSCCMPQCVPCEPRCGAPCSCEGYGYNTTCQMPRYTNLCAPNVCNVPAPLQVVCAPNPCPPPPCQTACAPCTPCAPACPPSPCRPGVLSSIMNRLSCMESDLSSLNNCCG